MTRITLGILSVVFIFANISVPIAQAQDSTETTDTTDTTESNASFELLWEFDTGG